MDSSFERSSEDPLGFTKQTATMLVGLGAGDLIPQCRKRNISTQGLASLSKHDLIVLGADDRLADEMLKQLRAAARKYGGRDLSEELRRDQLIKILTGANQQLNLIETFVAYARLRLAERPADFVIDSDKNIRASEALCSAAACTIADVEELERNFRALASDFTDVSMFRLPLRAPRCRPFASAPLRTAAWTRKSCRGIYFGFEISIKNQPQEGWNRSRLGAPSDWLSWSSMLENNPKSCGWLVHERRRHLPRESLRFLLLHDYLVVVLVSQSLTNARARVRLQRA